MWYLVINLSNNIRGREGKKIIKALNAKLRFPKGSKKESTIIFFSFPIGMRFLK